MRNYALLSLLLISAPASARRKKVDQPVVQKVPSIEWVDLGRFSISKTEVTVGQYRKCVEAGACTAPDTGITCNWGQSGREDHPIDCLDFSQAHAFLQWGGRLPTGTVGQYRKCVEAGACTAPDTGTTCNWGQSGREDHPINCVDWNQAQAFAKWAGGRLPTGKEWTYAATSRGKSWKYPWGYEEATCSRAIMDDGGEGCGQNRTWPVCSKPAGNSKQGVCDLAGNVWEWVQDGLYETYSGAPGDGRAWEGGASYRVVRGGSWSNAASGLRASYRSGGVPTYRIYALGFRLAR